MNKLTPEDRVSVQSIISATYLLSLLNKMDDPNEVMDLLNHMWDKQVADDFFPKVVPPIVEKAKKQAKVAKKIAVKGFTTKDGVKVSNYKRSRQRVYHGGKKGRTFSYTAKYNASKAFSEKLKAAGIANILRGSIQLSKQERSNLANNLVAFADSKKLTSTTEVKARLAKDGFYISSAGIRNFMRGENPAISGRVLEGFCDWTGIGPKELLSKHA